ncbi:hypothetical protein [Cytobacillus sp. Bac17]|uniref:hypothetical protein n=1 Tax=Cytobacillus sp. Bac17 TaxID=2926008 RepID=UPI0021190539|nr:hypothetical protein [Cytobacillus sp. Bac17]
MFEKTTNYFKRYIAAARRNRLCSSQQAKLAWEKAEQLMSIGNYDEGVFSIIQDISKYGKALPYDVIVKGLEIALGEGAAA